MSIIAYSQSSVVIKPETEREREIVANLPTAKKKRQPDGKYLIRVSRRTKIPELKHALEEEKCQLRMF